jgi:prefoldin subunit 5
MNSVQRKQLAKLTETAREYAAQVYALRNEFEYIQSDEQEKLENLPESLQGSDRATKLQEDIDALDTIVSAIESATDSLQEAIDTIESHTF